MTTVFAFLPQPKPLQGAPAQGFSGTAAVRRVGRLKHDLRQNAPTTGVIADSVTFKAPPTAPEAPFVGVRVWLLRAVDGYKAWEGYSDATGQYRATGLEVGAAYIPVGINLAGDFKAVAAGPVVAVEGI